MPRWAPEPPVPLPPGRTVLVPGRGEMFLRDTGGDGPPVLLAARLDVPGRPQLVPDVPAAGEAGYRVLALDQRGHGRGLRSAEPFR